METRFFVDQRVGCVAVRDKKHPKYDPEYNGLHSHLPDVIYFAQGEYIEKEWSVGEMYVNKANDVCQHLNNTL